MKNKRNKNNENIDNNRETSKISVVWYPGHMAKTKKEIVEDLKLVDIVIEILDSRIPISSQNPDIKEIIKNKPKIIVLNKCDLADKTQNDLWVKYFKEKGQIAVLTNCGTGQGINEVLSNIEKISQGRKETDLEKGRTGRKTKVMVLGIPNVGKSSFINRIIKNSKLEVGNKPGVTKKKQWVRVNDKIDLLDTAGVLWPKIEDKEVALNLSYTGTIKDDILPITEIAYQLLKFLLQNYRENVIQRYKLHQDYIEKTLTKPQAENINIYEIMQEIGRKRGCIISGGEVDDEKTSKIIIEDFRTVKLGTITLEKVKQ